MTAPALTDLETRLAAPGGAALRGELAARLQALEQRLRERVAAGLPREDFPLWQSTAEAAAAARETLAAWPVETGAAAPVTSSNAPPPAGLSPLPTP